MEWPSSQTRLGGLVAFVLLATLAAVGPTPARAVDSNPCQDPLKVPDLLCPDLTMSAPFNIYMTKSRAGRKLLRSANSINSVGQGPVEVRGTRSGPRRMKALQRIYSAFDGTLPTAVDTGASLRFYYVPGFGGYYWKFVDTAQFEMWRLNEAGVRTSRVRVGEKHVYCLRDLGRTRTDLGGPTRRVYPACNKNPRKRAVTLGTSVGWSDIYPANYYEQWIDVTGLGAGCYAYVHVADPDNRIYERNEVNNLSLKPIRLPFKRRNPSGGCKALPPGGAALPAPIPKDPPPLPNY